MAEEVVVVVEAVMVVEIEAEVLVEEAVTLEVANQEAEDLKVNLMAAEAKELQEEDATSHS